jgi:thiamine pyrophosphate-dependent acetolactate synthase large subunit-like protein
MNLGTLVTIAEMSPRNLVHIVLDNDVYRTSGGQPVPNVGRTSYTGFAEAAGYANVYSFDDLDSFKSDIEGVLKQAGPTFITLKTVPAKERPPYPITFTASIISRFKTALQNT